MITTTINKTTEFAAGTRMKLTDAQARARRHILHKVGDGIYEATALVQFKAGEVVGIAGDLPKAVAATVADAAPVAKTAGKSKAK